MRKIGLVAMAIALALAGCGTSGRITDASNTGVNRPPEARPSSNVEDSPSATQTSAPRANPTFGQTYTYEDGLTVTVSAPQPYTPSENASVGEPPPPAFVSFDVTIVNGTSANFEPGAFQASLQSGNTEQDQLFDSANGVSGSPSTTLLPGRESVFKIAFGATDPNDLVLEIAPSFEYDSVIFTS